MRVKNGFFIKKRCGRFKKYIEWDKKSGTIERTRNKWNKIWNKKTEYAGWWNKLYLETLDVNLTTLDLRCKIKRLKEEVKNKEDELLDHLLDVETKVSKLLTNLEYKEIETLHNITVLESKLIKLEISPEQIDRIKNSS